VFLEEDVEDRAQHGAMDRADAADERNEQGVEGPGRAEGVRRVVADVVVGEEPTGEPRERRRERERQELEPERADAARLGRLLVLADRPHAEPETRAAQRRDDGDGGGGQRERSEERRVGNECSSRTSLLHSTTTESATVRRSTRYGAV